MKLTVFNRTINIDDDIAKAYEVMSPVTTTEIEGLLRISNITAETVKDMSDVKLADTINDVLNDEVKVVLDLSNPALVAKLHETMNA